MKNYNEVKKGQEVKPVKKVFAVFTELKNCRFFVATRPRESNFPQPLTLRIKKTNGKFYLQTQRWSGHWFK